MPYKDIQEYVNTARETLKITRLQPLDQAALNDTLDELEMRMQQAEPVNPAPFIDVMTEWQAKLEVEHPVLAGVLANVVQRLNGIGV